MISWKLIICWVNVVGLFYRIQLQQHIFTFSRDPTNLNRGNLFLGHLKYLINRITIRQMLQLQKHSSDNLRICITIDNFVGLPINFHEDYQNKRKCALIILTLFYKWLFLSTPPREKTNLIREIYNEFSQEDLGFFSKLFKI